MLKMAPFPPSSDHHRRRSLSPPAVVVTPSAAAAVPLAQNVSRRHRHRHRLFSFTAHFFSFPSSLRSSHAQQRGGTRGRGAGVRGDRDRRRLFTSLARQHRRRGPQPCSVSFLGSLSRSSTGSGLSPRTGIPDAAMMSRTDAWVFPSEICRKLG